MTTSIQRHRLAVRLGMLMLTTVIAALLSCKPTTGLVPKGESANSNAKSRKNSEVVKREKNVKEGEVAGPDDTLFNESQPAVPPEVLTGAYLTCAVKKSNDPSLEVALGCSAYQAGERVALQAPNTKWFVTTDPKINADVPVAAAPDSAREFDAVITFSKELLTAATSIKAVFATPTGTSTFTAALSSIRDLVSGIQISAPPAVALDDAGIQLTGSGRFTFDYKAGTMKVTPRAPTAATSPPSTGLAVRVLIATALTKQVHTHEFSWVEHSDENKGDILPGSLSHRWQNLRASRTGSLPYKIISYSSCRTCGTKPYDASMPKPMIAVEINERELVIDFGTAPNDFFGITLDLPITL